MYKPPMWPPTPTPSPAAAPTLREPLVEQCRDAGVELVEIATMKELGRLCGIHVGAACAALLR